MITTTGNDYHSEATETVVAVVGALGTQGGSVIRALRSSPTTSQWKIRALTSSPDSDSARSLLFSFANTNNDISVVYCDVNDPESILDAFKGCTHIFANTLFQGAALFSQGGQKAAEKLEYDHGMNLVRAAADTKTLKHLVWSTLPDCTVISQGKWRVPHFMSKQGANAYILGGYPGDEEEEETKETKDYNWGGLKDKTTLLSIGIYGSNFQNHTYRPIKLKSGSDDYMIQLPCPPDVTFSMAGDESHNVGVFVRNIFEQPKRSLSKWISCESERISCRQWVADLNEALRSQGLEKKSITFEECTMKSMEDRWGVLGNEIGQMMAYIGDVEERAFGNTSGLPEISAAGLGIDKTQLVTAKEFYQHFDCVALLKEVDDGERHLGTASR